MPSHFPWPGYFECQIAASEAVELLYSHFTPKLTPRTITKGTRALAPMLMLSPRTSRHTKHGTDKTRLLTHLNRDVHARLTESDLGGIGLRAIHNIEKHTDVFAINAERTVATCDNTEIHLTEDDLMKLHKDVEKYVRDTIAPVDGEYPVPEQGLNALDPSFFINATTVQKKANVEFLGGMRDLRGLAPIRSTRLIKKGEELLMQAKLDPRVNRWLRVCQPGR